MGHPYSGYNLMIVRKTGWRTCRECQNECRRKRRALVRAKKKKT